VEEVSSIIKEVVFVLSLRAVCHCHLYICSRSALKTIANSYSYHKLTVALVYSCSHMHTYRNLH